MVCDAPFPFAFLAYDVLLSAGPRRRHRVRHGRPCTAASPCAGASDSATATEGKAKAMSLQCLLLFSARSACYLAGLRWLWLHVSGDALPRLIHPVFVFSIKYPPPSRHVWPSISRPLLACSWTSIFGIYFITLPLVAPSNGTERLSVLYLTLLFCASFVPKSLYLFADTLRYSLHLKSVDQGRPLARSYRLAEGLTLLLS